MNFMSPACPKRSKNGALPAGYCDDGITQANRPITLGLNGQRHLQVSAEDAVKSLIFGWQEMKKYTRLLRWSWTSRGLVSIEEMKQMHPDMDESELHSCPDEPTPFSEIVPGVPLLVPPFSVFQQLFLILCWGYSSLIK